MTLDDMSAEQCLAQAMEYEHEGKLSEAIQLLKVASAIAPSEGIYRQERERLQRLLKGEREGARVGVDRAKPAQNRRSLGLGPAQEASSPPRRARRMRIAAMGAVAAVLGALGLFLVPEAPEGLVVMDASVYAAVAPVLKAESQPGSRSVFLTVDKSGWERLGEDGQAQALSGLELVLATEGRSQALLLEDGSLPLGVVQAGEHALVGEPGE